MTALIGPEDHRWLEAQRRAYFPPERNHLDAHLTLFHHLPPSIAGELRHRLTVETRRVPAPTARIDGLISLGRGVAYRVSSPGLEDIRARLADAFASMLTPQDRARWRAHVTIQNKVDPSEARALLNQLRTSFAPRPLKISGLAAWHYRGGPWSPLSQHKFA